MHNETDQAVYRILDANSNRAGEGLRTLEEYARFVLDDGDSTRELKSLRHDLTAAISLLDREKLIYARDTDADVGTEITLASESERASTSSVVAAAASRTQQSLRVLEEYSKTVCPPAGQQIEQIRYRFYTIAAALEQTTAKSDRHTKLADSQLYVLIDAGDSEDDFAETVKTLSTSGVDILQLRDSNQDDRTLYLRSQIGTKIANEHAALFIVNDRADIAAAACADGVHVGQDELPAQPARAIVGSDRLIGVSTHDLDQVHAAIRDGADYIGCGPVFAGKTKSFDHYVGPGFLQAVHDEPKSRPLPAFAIGGINHQNVTQVVATGFHRIAVTGAIRDAKDPTEAATKLRELLSPSS